MEKKFSNPIIRFFIGDVRDKTRLRRAMDGVDVVIHAAALKQVPACEYNPIEAVKTNIDGTINLIDSAIDAEVEKVLLISTDKAVHPVNLYGATKMVAEKLIIQGNAYVGTRKTRFSCVRYGNVIGSRGSVIPLFREQKETGIITITDPRMTRFWITLDQGVKFVIDMLEKMQGGEIFIPKIPSMRLVDLVKAIAPEARQEFIGIRPGEKLHEVLITEDEARHSVEYDFFYIIEPEFPSWKPHRLEGAKSLEDNFRFQSDTNRMYLSVNNLKEIENIK